MAESHLDGEDCMKRPASPSPLPLFVTSDVRMLEAERERLAAALKRMRQQHRHGAILRTEFRLQQITGREVVLQRKVDPSLVGGVVARVGDQVFDGSLKNRLSELKSELLR